MTIIERIDKQYIETKNKKAYSGIYQLYIKRIFDITISLLVLPVLFLLFIPIAIMIKREDGGPIFYSSKRLGVGFKEFGMLKFRSMKVNSPDLRNADGSTYNSETDSRVTKIGKFIRETSIDELPQIFNVLFGDMCIVGPRAGDVESKNTYSEYEKDKLLIKPGITGYTQAYFRNNLGVSEKRLCDAWYAHNVSLLLDLKIIIQTVKIVLLRKNIYTNKD